MNKLIELDLEHSKRALNLIILLIKVGCHWCQPLKKAP
jgi:hypothetical protein